MKNLFITLEGIEGVGKSTHLPYLEEILRAQNHAVVITREPGGTILAEKIRSMLLAQYEESVTPVTELLMMFAGRSQHLANVIKPALQQGKSVICDRFTDSSYAYQGYGRGMDREPIAQLEKIVHADLQPDLTLLFDAPVEIALQRIQKRKNLDRFEKEKVDFFERVRAGYLERTQQFPQRYHLINASLSIAEVQQQLSAIMKKYV